jgi:hypothetical protein
MNSAGKSFWRGTAFSSWKGETLKSQYGYDIKAKRKGPGLSLPPIGRADKPRPRDGCKLFPRASLSAKKEPAGPLNKIFAIIDR